MARKCKASWRPRSARRGRDIHNRASFSCLFKDRRMVLMASLNHRKRQTPVVICLHKKCHGHNCLHPRREGCRSQPNCSSRCPRSSGELSTACARMEGKICAEVIVNLWQDEVTGPFEISSIALDI
jgi:hypothetical protein